MRKVLAGVLGPGLLWPMGFAIADEGHYEPWGNSPSATTAYPTSPDSPAAATTRLELLGHVNPGAGLTGDVYAHRGFAYLASWDGDRCPAKGIRVYDLADPRHPRRVSTFADQVSDPRLAHTWTEKVIVTHVKTSAFTGDLAVASVQNCRHQGGFHSFRGFGLYDVTDPAHPRTLGLYNTGWHTRGSHEIWLQAVGSKAYVYTAVPFSELETSADGVTPGRPDFRIYDVSTPTHAREVGGWGAWAELGLPPTPNGKYQYPTRFAHSVRVDPEARLAYVSYWDLGTVILDISDPSHPTLVGRTPGDGGAAHSSYVSDHGRLLVETHEKSGGVPTYYDLSDPSHPKRISRFVVKGYQNISVHDPKVVGDLTYFSWYDDGIVVADWSDPSRPLRLAEFRPNSTYVNPDGGDWLCSSRPRCSMVWGVFVYHHLVLASDMNSGLYVLRLRSS